MPSSECAAQALYNERCCARLMKIRTQEQLMFFADWTSTDYLSSDQVRLYLSSVTYLLMQVL